MLVEALEYPLERDDAIRGILIGGGLLFVSGLIYLLGILLSVVLIGLFLIPFAFVPFLFIQGYLIDVMRTTLMGAAEPPAFDDWGQLGIDGLKAFVIGLVYSLPLVALTVIWTVVFSIGTAVTDPSPGAGGEAFGALFTGSTVVFVVLTLVYSLVLAYLFPLSLANFAREDDLTAAFDLDVLKQVGLSSEYALPWLLAYVVILVVNNFLGFLVFLLVGFPIIFYGLMVGFRLYATGFADAMELEMTAPEGTG